MAVTRVLHRQGRLARYVTNVGFGDPDLGGRRAVPAALSRLMSQKVLRGLPSTDVSHVGVLSELAHLAMRRVPGGAAAASRRMYTSKRVFDAHLARSLNDVRLRTGATVVLGMYGSASRTFEQAHRLGMKTVLNFVNSEPRTQNALLAKYAALPSEHHEMIPAHVAVEVEREIGAADLILVPSAFVRDQLRRLGVPDGRLALIRYGVDLAAFGGSVERADASPDSPLRALFLGQVAFRKGIPTLLDAMRGLIGQVELEIRGPVTSPELLDDLPSNCRYVGTSSHQDLPGILARADVLVLPSYEDSFALVVTEAMLSLIHI